MDYKMIVLDLDGTLTNSQKRISPPTKEALFEIQEQGIIVVLASGRPINGVLPLAKELRLDHYDSYILSFNGARITRCRNWETIYNKCIPTSVIQPILDITKQYPGVDLFAYDTEAILSAIEPNEYTEMESFICKMPIHPIDHFVDHVTFPVNKLLIAGEPDVIEALMKVLQAKFNGLLNIYRSEPYYLEIMPQNIDKAHSLQKLISSIGISPEEMICCGDGYNDITMIEYAGLGVAMGNAQSIVKETADFITLSNDEDGVLHVIKNFLVK